MREAARAQLDALDRSARRHATNTAPGASMVWRSWGAGPPLVLLHGGAGSWMHWVRNIEALARHHTLWVPDLPGMGDSDLPREGLDADSIAPLVLDGATQLLKGAAFDLVGFSFGSLVAGFTAHLAPGQVRRMVLTGGTGLNIHPGPRHELRSLRGITDERERDAVLRHNLGAIMIADPTHIDDLAIAVQDRSAQRDRVRNRVLARTDAMLRICTSWRCPVWGVWGEDDNVRRADPAIFDAAVQKLGLRERQVLHDAGHWVQFERADAYNALLTHWLDPARTPV